MKVEKISDTTLEILLTKSDLDEKKINIDDFLENDDKARKILYDLMDEVENKYNITIQSNGLFKMNVLNHTNGDVLIIISAYNNVDDKVELYHKLYKQLEQNLPLYNNILNKYSEKNIENKIQKIPNKENKSSIMIYSSDNLSNIKNGLESINVNFKNEVIYKYKNKYYLILYLKVGSSKKKIESILSEFATLISQQNFEFILQEYGEKIIKESAKNILKMYF